MTWVRVPKEEFARIRKLAAERKAKRAEKREALLLAKLTPARALELVKPKKKRRKKSPREVQRDRNDALWSLAVRRRDTAKYGPRCRICGQHANSGRQMVGYHLVPKKRGDAIRWLLENGIQGCTRCNFGERLNVSLYREKHVALVGVEMMERLEALAHVSVDWSLDDLKAIGAWLKAVNEAAPGVEPPRPLCLPVV